MTSSFGDQRVPMMTSANNVGEGWHQILQDLEKELNELSPDFELLQVKEKFGGLRYYASPQAGCTEGAVREFHERIREAEDRSFRTCEVCGEPGEVRRDGWLKTLCDKHTKEKR